MDLQNSFEIENKNYSAPINYIISNNDNNFEDNLNLENIEKDFIISKDFNNNNFDPIDNLVIDFNSNIHLHAESNINSIEYIDKSKINKKLATQIAKKELVFNTEEKNTNYNEKGKRKSRKKIDLDKTPLPIFACIYCSNENVVFKHMINEILSDKYLHNCSRNDLKNVNILVSTYFVYNLTSVNLEIKSLVKLILNYSEYLVKLYSIKNSEDYIKNYTERSIEKKEIFKPLLKYRFVCTENTMMTFFFKNTSI